MGGSALDPLTSLGKSLKDSLHKSASESDKRRLTSDMQKLVWSQQRQESATPAADPAGEVEPSDEMRRAVETLRAKEEVIEKRKAEVHQRVQEKLSKVEFEVRSLDNLRKELENLEDPTRKEVNEIRKKIEAVDRELKPLKLMCEKKEKEFKEATKAHEDKVKQKAALVSKLTEVVNASEAVRLQKLDELSRSFEALDNSKVAVPNPAAA